MGLTHAVAHAMGVRREEQLLPPLGLGESGGRTLIFIATYKKMRQYFLGIADHIHSWQMLWVCVRVRACVGLGEYFAPSQKSRERLWPKYQRFLKGVSQPRMRCYT